MGGVAVELQNDAAAISKSDTDSQVAIILGYYNGNKYLSEQLRSIFDQSYSNFKVFISDDCSKSEVDIESLNLSSSETEKVYLGIRSNNVGFTQNFLDALGSVDGAFEYFAFSDQDDVWDPSKIQRALTVLQQSPTDKPAIYCARTTAWDETCQVELGSSTLFDKPPSFANALVQSIGGGNTMVFNKAARDLIVASSADVEVVSHDWWCYQILSGAGGFVYYDPISCLKYRQHSDNIVGINSGWSARFVRILGLLKGKYRIWNDVNGAALVKNKDLLTSDNQECLDNFMAARQSDLIKRFFLFRRSGIYRQTLMGNLGLLLALLTNKV